MINTGFGRTATALGMILMVAGCMEGGGFSTNRTADGEPVMEDSTRLIERDVEAPDVFQATENGLWDGRPSLGGVWVAYPGVTDPERVIIRNEENGKFVIGALFNRERDNPGPRLMVSSDAASALGVLAGAPTRLNVTALRKEQVPVDPPAPEPEEVEEEIESEELAPLAAAAAAIEAAESKAAGQQTATKPLGAIMPAGASAAPPAKPATAAPAPVAAPTVKAEPKMAPEKVTAEAAPPAEPLAAPMVKSDPVPAQASAAAPAPAANQGPAPVAEKLEKPFIQIGIFSVEENAFNTATSMRMAGILPTVDEGTSQGKPFWRVIVGPTTTADERTALFQKIKDLGYNDAYFVTN